MANPSFESVDYDAGPPVVGIRFVFTDAELPVDGSSYFPQAIDDRVGEIVHARNDLPIAVYPVDNRGLWEMEMLSVPKANILSLKQFFQLRTFLYYPDSGAAPNYWVRWVEPEFNAKLVGGGTATPKFDLSFTIEEIV